MSRSTRNGTLISYLSKYEASASQSKSKTKGKLKQKEADDKAAKANAQIEVVDNSTMVSKMADVVMADNQEPEKVDNVASDVIAEVLPDPKQGPDDEFQELHEIAVPPGEISSQKSLQIEVSGNEEKKMDVTAKIPNGELAHDKVTLAQMMNGTIQTNQASSTAKKKRKKKRMALNKTVRQGQDGAGNPIEITEQAFYWQEYTPPESEDDNINSEDDAEIDRAMASTEAPEGVRGSGREKNNKLRRANLKNDKLVSNTLEKLEVGDVSSDGLEDAQESDEDEEVKE